MTRAKLHDVRRRPAVSASLVDGYDPAVAATVFRFAPLYSGGPAQVDVFEADVWVDVASLRIDPAPKALLDHDFDAIVGRLENIEKRVDPETGRLSVFCDAVVGGNELAARVVAWARDVADWVPSIGAYRVDERDVVFLSPGETRRINGAIAAGPCYLIFNACLCEGSFVAIGGDGGAKAILARVRAERKLMTSFEEFCAAKGIDPTTATQEELDALRQEYEETGVAATGEEDEETAVAATGATDEEDEETAVAAEADVPVAPTATEELVEAAVEEVVDALPPEEAEIIDAETQTEIVEEIVDELEPVADAVAASLRATALAKRKIKARVRDRRRAKLGGAAARLSETRRVEAIKALCAPRGKVGARIAATAIAHGWGVERTDKTIRASLSRDSRKKSLKIPGVGRLDANGAPRRADVLAAALAMTCGMTPKRVQAAFRCDQRVVDAALDKRNRGATIRTIVAESNNSFSPGSFGLNTSMNDAFDEMRANCRSKAVLARGLRRGVLATAGFSTIDATEIFTAVLQAFLEPSPEKAARRYRELTRENVCLDLNVETSFSATLKGRLSEIPETGLIEKLSFTTEKFERAALANGATFTVPEQLFINDRIDAFAELANQLADLGDDCVENDVAEAFWDVVDGDALYQNAAMVSTERGNFLTGEDSVLDENGLGAAKAALNAMKNANGFPFASGNEILVTGSALFAKANRLYTSEYVNVADTIGSTNVFRGVYRPVEWAYLDKGNCRKFKRDGATASLFAANPAAWFLLRDPARRPCVCVNKVRGYESPQIRQFDAPADVWGTTYRLIYPYSVTTQHPDAIVVCQGS